MPAIPILFLGDCPAMVGGLSRILRELATRVSAMPEFRVGTLGRLGRYSRYLPFAQYSYWPHDNNSWGEGCLEEVWTDFAGGERGIVFTIWDASRLLWFARPEYSGSVSIKNFLTSDHFDRWGYFPVDATGPNMRQTAMARDTWLGYNRLLAYSKFGLAEMQATLGAEEAARRRADWIPHGIDADVFQPRSKSEGREVLNSISGKHTLHEQDVLIGIIATNQARKDWGLAIATCSALAQRIPHLKVWCHIDTLERHWSLPALLNDFQLEAVVTTSARDEVMSYCYSACDLTLAPGLGEGFGYPAVESLFCGVPVIHGDYGGGAEFIPQELRVSPISYRLETLYNCVRPVFEPAHWVQKAEEALGKRYDPEWCRAQVIHLSWPMLWEGCWSKWFMERL